MMDDEPNESVLALCEGGRRKIYVTVEKKTECRIIKCEAFCFCAGVRAVIR